MLSNLASSALQADTMPRARFIIAHGEKRGVGKSFVAQALADFLSRKGDLVAVVDVDTHNPDVARMFAYALPTARVNLRAEQGWAEVMDFVVQHPGHTIIMNTPAGISAHMTHELVSFSRFLKHQQVPLSLELWWTMNANHDSVDLFSNAYENYSEHFSAVRVLCNLHYSSGNEQAFLLWNESALRTKIEKQGGGTLFFPALHIRVVNKLVTPLKMMPFSHAVDPVAGEEIGLENSERWKLQKWLLDVSAVFAPAFAAANVLARIEHD